MTQTAHTLEPAKSQEPEALRTEFQFYSLPRSVQDRFLLSVNGTGVPEPILFTPLTRRLPWGALALGLLSVGAALFVLRLGFGNLNSSFAIQPRWFALVYFIALGGVGAVAAQLWLTTRGSGAAYRSGYYLFPVGVVAAIGDRIRLLPLTELRKVSVSQAGSVRRAELEFPRQKVAFQLPPGLELGQLEERLGAHRAQFEEAWSARNRRALAVLDPTRDSGFSNPLSSADRMRPPRDTRWLVLAAGALLGALAGAGLFYVRNVLGERALYRNAVVQNTQAALEAYLHLGGTRPEVSEVLLPRAQLTAARGSLSAVEQFAAASPDSKIRPEIDGALREELLQELDRVRAAGTLGAVADFIANHPSHKLVEKELTTLRRKLYDAALASYRQRFSPEPAAAKLFEELLRFSEANGPRVAIQFRRVLTSSAERADSAIRKSGYYTGSQAIPSRYFDAPHAEAREKEIGAQLIQALQAPFAPELLSFELLAGQEGGGPLPEVTVPTLFITYTTDMSGGFTTNRPRGVYVGLGITIQSTFVIPPARTSYEFRDSSWLPPDVNEISRNMLTPKDVYENNARTALNRFRERFQARLMPAAK